MSHKANDIYWEAVKGARDQVVVGQWDGQPIVRPKTAEEKLLEAGIEPELANKYIILDNSL